MPSDERELILREALVYAQRTKEALSMDTQQVFLPTTSGEDKECYWSFHLIPVLFEQQQLLCIILKIDDVTDFERMRKRANEQQRRNVELEATEKIHLRKLKESEARFLGIFNLSPIPVFMLNAADEKLVLVNSAFEKFFNIL